MDLGVLHLTYHTAYHHAVDQDNPMPNTSDRLPIVFSLLVEEDGDTPPVRYGFAGSIPIIAGFQAQLEIEQQARWYAAIHDACTTTYGSHEWRHQADDRVACLGGYVAPASCACADILEAWRSALLAELGKKGLEIGPVVAISGDDRDDYAIYTEIVERYAQPSLAEATMD